MKINDLSIRPLKIDDFIGQENIKNILKIILYSSNERKESLDHILLIGQAGLGKTTLANIIANERGSKIITTSAPSLEKNGDLAGLLSLLKAGDVLFIDEIHRLSKSIEELLYSAMEDYSFSITVTNDKVSKPMVIPIPPFTLIGATTKMGSLDPSFYDRFTFVLNFEYYSQKELEQIIKRTSSLYKIKLDDESIFLIASRSRSTPRIANKLVKKIRDFYLYRKLKIITKDDTIEAFKIFNIDELGLERIDRQYLEVLINEFSGGPTGATTIASRLNQDVNNVIEIVEPYLLRQGLISRTPRGRVASEKAYNHLRIPYNKK